MTKLPYVYAALLDILGYRERLERDRKNGNLDFKDVLVNSLSCLSTINDAEIPHQAISDTIILTCSDRSKIVDLLRVLKSVQISFLSNGLFLRGGVTFQPHFKSGAITYSPAYAGAHEIETKVAIYPRIVLDFNIIDMLESCDESGPLSESELLCECNGVYFVNVIDSSNWMSLYGHAKAVYEADSNGIRTVEGVFAKHYWFQEYLFASIHADPDATRYMPSIRVWRT